MNCDSCASVAVEASFAGRLTAAVTTAGGCAAARELLIERLRLNPPNLDQPTAFSPNGDSVNDGFGILVPQDRTLVRAEVYDRWGGMVARTACPCAAPDGSGLTPVWDGRHAKGDQLVGVGVYVWLAELRAADGGSEIWTGEVTVVR